jgi:transcriptional regulator with GAF, ATPase, and Fis domain
MNNRSLPQSPNKQNLLIEDLQSANALLQSQLEEANEETQQRNAELAVINSVQQGLAAQIDMQGIYDLVGDRVREILDTQTVMITIYDHEQGEVKTPYLYEKGERYFLPNRPLSEHSRHQKSPKDSTLFNTAEEWQAGGLHHIEGTTLMQSFLGVPLKLGEMTIGAINIHRISVY